jgi:AraC-like DNA-binding protein
MKSKTRPILHINSVSALHRFAGLPAPAHPLISVFRCGDLQIVEDDARKPFICNLYMISNVPGSTGKPFRYGQSYYDFNEGSLCFLAPGHLINDLKHGKSNGTSIVFSPDLLTSSDLARTIKSYDFFSYVVNRALQVSMDEESVLLTLMGSIEKEYQSNPDPLTEKVIISHLDLLLAYCARFYRRQHLMHINKSTHPLLSKLETYLDEALSKDDLGAAVMPTVQLVADQLYVSAAHLTDVLRSTTGQNTQQYIHSKVIERAKLLLGNTDMNISQVAYSLGFEYVQSFNKLFKKKVNMTPLAYRKSFS